MLRFDELSLALNVAIFAAAACAIGITGWKLAGVADILADRTRLGEAIAGAVFLGASTSLPGIITSVTAGFRNHPELAVSNAIGGIAAQTAFLAVADVFYTRANLEHAAASVGNILQATLLLALLTFPLLAVSGPEWTLGWVHPATPLMIAAYAYGLHLVRESKTQPMWRPRQTSETREDVPDEDSQKMSVLRLWLTFSLTAAAVGVSGWLVARSGIALAEKTGLSETAVGGVLTAVATSLPELVTSVAAVRQGALTLAVGGVIGGNAFDTLFLAGADVSYRNGSIYHSITHRETFLIALTILMTAVLLMGLVRREKRGIGNIGFESFTILVLYGVAVLFMFASK